MLKYRCYPLRGVLVHSPCYQVNVSERLSLMPYAQCGFINTTVNDHSIKIFISYITPIFAVIDNEYIIGLKCARTPTTAKQVTKALQQIYPPMENAYSAYFYKYCPCIEDDGIALNLCNGEVLDLPVCVEDFLTNFAPTYTKVSD